MRMALSVIIRKRDAFSVCYESKDPDTVAQVANAVTEQLVHLHEQHVLSQIREERALLQQEIGRIERELAEYGESVETSETEPGGSKPSEIRIGNSEGKYEALRSNYVELLRSARDAKSDRNEELASSDSQLVILEEAVPPTSPIGPDRSVSVCIGAAIGLVIGRIASRLRIG